MQTKTLKFAAISGLIICFSQSGCTSTFVANLQRSSEKEVAVFTTLKPTQEYIELKYIQVDGSLTTRPEKLLTKLTEKAKKEGADAVINVKFDFQCTWPIVSGTAIKYKTSQN